MRSDMRTRIYYYLIVFLISGGLFASVFGAENDLSTEIIRDKIEQIRFFEEVKLGEASIASIKVLPEIYEQQNFQRIWTE